MTKRPLAIGALVTLSIAACDPPRSRPPAISIVHVAAEATAPEPPSVPESPLSEQLSASGRLPPCKRDASRPSHPLLCAKAPDLGLPRVTGTGPGSLTAARGQIVLLAFCATFVAPCQKSLPVFQAIAKEHSGRVTLLVLMVDSPEDTGGRKHIEEYASDLQLDAPLFWDTKNKAADAYAISTLPTTMIVDPAGTVRAIYAGYRDGEGEAIRAEIKDLFAGSQDHADRQ